MVIYIKHLSPNLGVGMYEAFFIFLLLLITFASRSSHLACLVHKRDRQTSLHHFRTERQKLMQYFHICGQYHDILLNILPTYLLHALDALCHIIEYI